MTVMPVLLNIDTATDLASVCISDGEAILGSMQSHDQKNHASFIQPAIEALCKNTGTDLNTIDAVAVTAGPGSYTGIRVGMATAKGICYALQKPLILVSTLEVMAQSMLLQHTQLLSPDLLLCPMIDARRMEVFTALFNQSLQSVTAPHALVLSEDSFAEQLARQPVLFAGSGMPKLRAILQHPNALYAAITCTAADLATLSLKAYQSGRFSDLAYSEPLYVKEFFDTSKLKSD